MSITHWGHILANVDLAPAQQRLVVHTMRSLLRRRRMPTAEPDTPKARTRKWGITRGHFPSASRELWPSSPSSTSSPVSADIMSDTSATRSLQGRREAKDGLRRLMLGRQFGNERLLLSDTFLSFSFLQVMFNIYIGRAFWKLSSLCFCKLISTSHTLKVLQINVHMTGNPIWSFKSFRTSKLQSSFTTAGKQGKSICRDSVTQDDPQNLLWAV